MSPGGNGPAPPGTRSDAHQPDEVARLGRMVNSERYEGLQAGDPGGRGTHGELDLIEEHLTDLPKLTTASVGDTAHGVLREQLLRLKGRRTRLGRTVRRPR